MRWLGALLVLTGCGFFALDSELWAAQLLSHPEFEWAQDSTEHFTTFTEKGTAAERRAGVTGVLLEQGRTRALNLLGVDRYEQHINVFVVGSRDRMKKLVGRAINGIAYHGTHTIALVVTDEWRGSPGHELFHVMAMNSWGVGPVWLNEGMGVYADGRWEEQDLHRAARALLERKQIVPLPRLIRDFRKIEENIAYPQAGSIARHIYERHGRDAVRALWREDLRAFQELTGKSLRDVESEWLELLQKPELRVGIRDVEPALK